MRFKVLVLAVLVSLLPVSASADADWHGPGWYVMAYQYAVIIWSGPYASKDACLAAKPRDGDPDGFEYDCSYLEHEPG
jgi:hypothetical protein